jgi:hypothetical protein
MGGTALYVWISGSTTTATPSGRSTITGRFYVKSL